MDFKPCQKATFQQTVSCTPGESTRADEKMVSSLTRREAGVFEKRIRYLIAEAARFHGTICSAGMRHLRSSLHPPICLGSRLRCCYTRASLAHASKDRKWRGLESRVRSDGGRYSNGRNGNCHNNQQLWHLCPASVYKLICLKDFLKLYLTTVTTTWYKKRQMSRREDGILNWQRRHRMVLDAIYRSTFCPTGNPWCTRAAGSSLSTATRVLSRSGMPGDTWGDFQKDVVEFKRPRTLHLMNDPDEILIQNDGDDKAMIETNRVIGETFNLDKYAFPKVWILSDYPTTSFSSSSLSSSSSSSASVSGDLLKRTPHMGQLCGWAEVDKIQCFDEYLRNFVRQVSFSPVKMFVGR